MEIEGEISLFSSYKCEENCPNQSHAHPVNLDLECDHVCYEGCKAICTDDYDPIFQFEIQVESILFVIGNTLSMLGLLLTFLTFCTFKSLRNVSGRCIMNLVAALFLAKFSFQVNPSFTNISHKWCSLMAMAQHYFCLCAFHWTSVLAYDLYVTVKKGRRSEEMNNCKSIRNKRKNTHPTFFSYFVFAWGFPWSAIIACLTLESLTHYGFHYGNHEHCGVFGDDALLYSLAIPLLVITLLNTCLYIVVVCHPGLTRQMSLHRANKYSIKDNRYLQQIKSAAVRRDVAARSSSNTMRYCVMHNLPAFSENQNQISHLDNINQDRQNVISQTNEPHQRKNLTTSRNEVNERMNEREPTVIEHQETLSNAVENRQKSDAELEGTAQFVHSDNGQQNSVVESDNSVIMEEINIEDEEVNVSNAESRTYRYSRFDHDPCDDSVEAGTRPNAGNAEIRESDERSTAYADPMTLYRAEIHEMALLRIYVNMSFLMALAWLSGFLAAIIHIYEIWILFIIWNMLQGVFIFKSFVLQIGVRRMWLASIKSLIDGSEMPHVEEKVESDEEPKWKFLSRNLPKRIIGSWQNGANQSKDDKQPLYINHIDL